MAEKFSAISAKVITPEYIVVNNRYATEEWKLFLVRKFAEQEFQRGLAHAKTQDEKGK